MDGEFDVVACSFVYFELSASSVDESMFPQRFTDQAQIEPIVCGMREEVPKKHDGPIQTGSEDWSR